MRVFTAHYTYRQHGARTCQRGTFAPFDGLIFGSGGSALLRGDHWPPDELFHVRDRLNTVATM